MSSELHKLSFKSIDCIVYEFIIQQEDMHPNSPDRLSESGEAIEQLVTDVEDVTAH